MKYILLLLLLSGCSTSFLSDKNKNTSASVESRVAKNINSADNTTVTIIEEPKAEVVRPQVIERKDPNKLFSDYTIYFDLDEYVVQEKYKPLLKKHGEFLAKNPHEFVFIEGHTDERGGREYNLALGQRRANAVRLELMIYGAKDNQLEAYSYGSEKPKALGSTEEAWSQNRRVELHYKN